MIRYAAGAPQFTKIAVTVPTETYAVVERLRRQLGKSRSAVVALALEEWIRAIDVAEADRRYVDGYLRTPETPEAVDEVRAVAAQATASWGSWSPGEPLRAAEPSPALPASRAGRTSRAAPKPTRAKRSPERSPKRSPKRSGQ